MPCSIYTTDLLCRRRPGAPAARRWRRRSGCITDVPRRLYGLRQRGRVEPGWDADLVVFDPDTVGHGPGAHAVRPARRAPRLLPPTPPASSTCFVNGAEIVAAGEPTGAPPGTLLRSGRDTDTVEV